MCKRLFKFINSLFSCKKSSDIVTEEKMNELHKECPVDLTEHNITVTETVAIVEKAPVDAECVSGKVKIQPISLMEDTHCCDECCETCCEDTKTEVKETKSEVVKEVKPKAKRPYKRKPKTTNK